MQGFFPTDKKKTAANKKNTQNPGYFIPNSFNKIEIDDIEFFECCGSAWMGRRNLFSLIVLITLITAFISI